MTSLPGFFDLPDQEALREPTSIDRAAQRKRWQERLQPRVLELAKRAGVEGITAADVLSAAIVDWGVLPGPAPAGDPRRDAWIGSWLAQLARAGLLVRKTHHGIPIKRKSERKDSHSNEGYVYLHADVAAGVQGAA